MCEICEWGSKQDPKRIVVAHEVEGDVNWPWNIWNELKLAAEQYEEIPEHLRPVITAEDSLMPDGKVE